MILDFVDNLPILCIGFVYYGFWNVVTKLYTTPPHERPIITCMVRLLNCFTILPILRRLDCCHKIIYPLPKCVTSFLSLYTNDVRIVLKLLKSTHSWIIINYLVQERCDDPFHLRFRWTYYDFYIRYRVLCRSKDVARNDFRCRFNLFIFQQPVNFKVQTLHL